MGRYTEKEKEHWLTDWQMSGQSIRAYAKDKPFSVASFNNWRRKKAEDKRATSFIQVQAPPSIPIQPYARLTYPTGVVLELYVSLDVSSIQALVQ